MNPAIKKNNDELSKTKQTCFRFHDYETAVGNLLSSRATYIVEYV